jgi:hypothetical protein
MEPSLIGITTILARANFVVEYVQRDKKVPENFPAERDLPLWDHCKAVGDKSPVRWSG